MSRRIRNIWVMTSTGQLCCHRGMVRFWVKYQGNESCRGNTFTLITLLYKTGLTIGQYNFWDKSPTTLVLCGMYWCIHYVTLSKYIHWFRRALICDCCIWVVMRSANKRKLGYLFSNSLGKSITDSNYAVQNPNNLTFRCCISDKSQIASSKRNPFALVLAANPSQTSRLVRMRCTEGFVRQARLDLVTAHMSWASGVSGWCYEGGNSMFI